MISKRIDRKLKTSDFDRLGRYVLEAKNDASSILWTRTAEYVVDLKAETEGEKVLWYRLSNCEAEIPAMAIAEVLVTQSQNTRSQADKTYHCVISFPEGEQPTRAQLEDIEDQMCDALGFGEHQRISAVHQDTDNIHLHLAINKVHPTTFKLHEPYRDYYIRDKTCRALELKHGLTVDNGMGQGQRYGKAYAIEAHTGEQTLLSWIQSEAKPALMRAIEDGGSWNALHQTMAEHGLMIKPRGAGLVITLMDGSKGIKASSVDKCLSFKALTERFGPYVPPENTQALTPTLETPKKAYQNGLRKTDEEAQALYSDFQSLKQAAWLAKSQLKERLTAEKTLFTQQLKAWNAQERLKIKQSSQSGQTKRLAYQQLAQARQAALQTHRQTIKRQKQAIQKTHPALTWEQFLIQQAEQGNSKALELLRQRKTRQANIEKALLTADDLAQAKHLIYQDLKPYIRKNGDLVYQVQDGGSVTDEKQWVSVSTVTIGSTLLALTLATERFQNQPLDVQGSLDFKRQLVQLAAQHQMALTFKDKALEQERQHLIQQGTMHARGSSMVTDESIPPALQAYITQRNLVRERVQHLKPHRAWSAQDKGTMIYQGRRTLTDGSEAILLETQDAMLVKPVQRPEDFKGLSVGQRIQLDENGQWQRHGHSRGRGR
jgi:cellobiose-specific phosphotransferase system component IIA